MNFIVIIFVVLCIVQISYFILFCKHLALKEENLSAYNRDLQRVSVVICAHNEEQNLKNNLPTILRQKYANLEVVVVVHNSNDNSLEIVKGLSERNDHLKYYLLMDGKQGKKTALAFGIEKSSHPCILVTDADCRPSSLDWVSSLVQLYQNNMVLGYGPYVQRPGVLNAFVRFETFMTACLYFLASKMKIPFMGVGRNMMYPKQWFMERSNFESHRHILSGDDDLFVQALGSKVKIENCLNESAFMYSEAPKNWRAWLNQKLRHVETGFYYKPSTKIYLGLYIFSGLVLYIILISHFKFLFPVYTITMIIKILLISRLMKKLRCADLLVYYFLLEALYFFYWPFVGIMKTMLKKPRW